MLEAIRAGAEAIWIVGMMQSSIRLSIGLVDSVDGGISLQKLLSRADTQVYRAKELGRNQVSLGLDA